MTIPKAPADVGFRGLLAQSVSAASAGTRLRSCHRQGAPIRCVLNWSSQRRHGQLADHEQSARPKSYNATLTQQQEHPLGWFLPVGVY